MNNIEDKNKKHMTTYNFFFLYFIVYNIKQICTLSTCSIFDSYIGA